MAAKNPSIIFFTNTQCPLIQESLYFSQRSSMTAKVVQTIMMIKPNTIYYSVPFC